MVSPRRAQSGTGARYQHPDNFSTAAQEGSIPYRAGLVNIGEDMENCGLALQGTENDMRED